MHPRCGHAPEVWSWCTHGVVMHPRYGHAPEVWSCTRGVVMHPRCGHAPVVWSCTRGVVMHPWCGHAPMVWSCTCGANNWLCPVYTALANWPSKLCEILGWMHFTSISDVFYGLPFICSVITICYKNIIMDWLNIGTVNFKITNLWLIFWLNFVWPRRIKIRWQTWLK